MSVQADEIRQWIIKGDHDLGTAKLTITFHCQQAVEKYLKAYLIFQQTTFRFSHDLIYLLELISQQDISFDKYYDAISELQGYAVEIRYPNETKYISGREVEKAITIAKNIRELVSGKINMKIDYNQIIDK
jgi:HEPN domain-containing protein